MPEEDKQKLKEYVNAIVTQEKRHFCCVQYKKRIKKF